ncbi:hypothetical protein VDG1235_2744 [Verrucomicrobiia bacterium DG1235]|nr:hypothetical protein VDG1235_2744 [Verrucomicrobiae bacterium DG1235]
MVRDEMGYPIDAEGVVILKTVSGVQIEAPLTPSLYVDASYRLEVPMDAGITSDSYKPSALNPLAPFTIEIQIGSQTYLPFEMSGDLAALGEAGGTTVINLTLGEDSDGDGIPDTWERALIAKTSRYDSLDDVNPGDDLDGDGLSNYEEYLANTYAYNVLDGLSLKIVSVSDSAYVIEFLSIADHRYTIYGSSDSLDWQEQGFKLESDAEGDEPRMTYDAAEVELLRVLVPRVAGGANLFRLSVR